MFKTRPRVISVRLTRSVEWALRERARDEGQPVTRMAAMLIQHAIGAESGLERAAAEAAKANGSMVQELREVLGE